MRLCRAVFFSALSLALPVIAQAADDTAALTERLHQAEITSSLDSADLKPWHLKLDVQLFREQGKPTEQGTIEEWWTSPTSYQITYTFPSYTANEIHTDAGLSRTNNAGSPPFYVALLLKQVVHPTPSDKNVLDSILALRKLTLTKVPLECAMLAQKVDNDPLPPLGLFPTYCFASGTSSLRISYDFGSQATVRNTIGVFQERNIATDVAILDNGQKRATAHLSTLESNPSLAPPQLNPSSLESVLPVQTGGKVVPGRRTGGEHPSIPENPKSRIAGGGKVVMKVTIGTDGRVRAVRITKASDSDLALAAIIGARNWTYTPFLLNGKPVEAEITVEINAKFGN